MQYSPFLVHKTNLSSLEGGLERISANLNICEAPTKTFRSRVVQKNLMGWDLVLHKPFRLFPVYLFPT